MKDRKANRLEGYDYSEDGCYFVTICAQGREELFGEIIGGEMVSSEAGWMVERTWSELPEFYRGVETDHFQVMPNHVHGVIVITGNEFPHRTVADRPLCLSVAPVPVLTKDNHGGRDNHGGLSLRCHYPTLCIGSNP